MTHFAALSLVALCLFANPSHAEFSISITQMGSNVVATRSGTIDTTDLQSTGVKGSTSVSTWRVRGKRNVDESADQPIA